MNKRLPKGGAICGGVMSETMMSRGMEKHGAYFGMMSYIMPDKQYKKYIAFVKLNKDKEARKLWDKFAYSQI